MAERAERKGKPEPDSFASGQTHGAADAPGPGSDEVQEKMNRAVEQGFYGVESDPTPNEAYTVAGVTAGQPTPETDPEHAEKVRQDIRGR